MRTQRETDLALLGLSPAFDSAALKRAYRVKAKELHPDTATTSDRSFHSLTEACDRLSKELREREKLTNGQAKPATTAPRKPGTTPPPPASRNPPRPAQSSTPIPVSPAAQKAYKQAATILARFQAINSGKAGELSALRDLVARKGSRSGGSRGGVAQAIGIVDVQRYQRLVAQMRRTADEARQAFLLALEKAPEAPWSEEARTQADYLERQAALCAALLAELDLS